MGNKEIEIGVLVKGQTNCMVYADFGKCLEFFFKHSLYDLCLGESNFQPIFRMSYNKF